MQVVGIRFAWGINASNDLSLTARFLSGCFEEKNKKGIGFAHSEPVHRMRRINGTEFEVTASVMAVVGFGF